MTEQTSGHYAVKLWSNKDIDKVIKATKAKFRRISYDCFIGSGLSGGIMAAHLAKALNKELLIVRKKGDNSHGCALEGYTKFKRGVIVDDFITTGATMDRIIESCDNIKYILLYNENKGTDEYKDIPVKRV
jgi:orotate phosphoribosyltransferase-like protein